MHTVEAIRSIKIPNGVEVKMEGRVVTIRGSRGTLTRDFSHAPVSIQIDEDIIKIWANWPRKKETALVGTVCSHIKNMITGVMKGFTYKLKIVFAHFPISVKLKNDKVLIENFTGERSPRLAKIVGDVKITVNGEDVLIQGINIEDVGQTVANIEQATKVKKKDPRVFLDGMFIYEKLEEME